MISSAKYISFVCLYFFIANIVSAQTPIADYLFSGNANDVSGNGLNGSVNNATLTTDRFNQNNSAYYFNGSTASITISYSSIFNFSPTGQFSISLWVQPETANSIGALFVKSPYNSNYVSSNWDYGLYLINNKAMSGYANNNFLNGTTTMTPSACWYHVAVTYNNGVWRLFVNGNIEAQDNSGTKFITQSSGGLSIGKKGDANGDFFKGKLDEIKVYNSALTSSQIFNLYKVSSSVITTKNINICLGDSAQLSAIGVGTFSWLPTAGLNNATIYNPKASPSTTIQYIVSLTSNGCVTKDTVQINVTDLHANAGPDVYSCKKDLIQLNGTGNGTSFTWSPIKYITNNIIPNPSVNPDTNITYVLTVWNGPCVSRDTMNVFVTSIDAEILNNDTFICMGDTVKFETVINGNSFNWDPILFLNDTHSFSPYAFPQTTTKYTLTVTRGSCIKKDTLIINVVTNLVANAGNDQQICAGNSVQLSGSGPTGAVFFWLPNYALSNNSISNPYANPLVDTSYFLKVQLGNNCVGYDTVKIIVNPNPTVDAGLDQNICREPFVTIGVSSTLADSFFWSPPAGLSDLNILQTQASPTANTKYFIKAINKNTGCFNFDTVNVSLIKPTAIFISDIQTGQLPLAVHFINSSTNAKNYLWNFGDTTATSSQINPDHIFIKEGFYKVILVAENNGCTDTAWINIQTTGGLFVFIPNAFTANGDGLNDEFVISFTSGALKKMHGTIWNRWGAKIYEFDMPGGKWWDGKVNGNFAQPDTYVYIIEATNWNDVTKTLSGNFTLLR